MQSFGSRLKRLRSARSISQAQLANRLGVSKVTVWKWERGDCVPRARHVLALADAFRVAPQSLGLDQGIMSTGGAEERRSDEEPPVAAAPERFRAEEDSASCRPRALSEVIEDAKAEISQSAGVFPQNIRIVIEY
jgi:transcriptional regulator with XRE-family HTH domain